MRSWRQHLFKSVYTTLSGFWCSGLLLVLSHRALQTLSSHLDLYDHTVFINYFIFGFLVGNLCYFYPFQVCVHWPYEVWVWYWLTVLNTFVAATIAQTSSSPCAHKRTHALSTKPREERERIQSSFTSSWNHRDLSSQSVYCCFRCLLPVAVHTDQGSLSNQSYKKREQKQTKQMQRLIAEWVISVSLAPLPNLWCS